MRTRNKRIVLVQSIHTYQPQSQSKFLQQNDAIIPMRIYQHQMQGQGHMAEIFYEALLNQTINKKQSNDMHTYRSIKSNTLETQVTEKRLNAGKIIRRSLGKNYNKSNTPQKNTKERMRSQLLVMDLAGKMNLSDRSVSARAGNKQNIKMAASCDTSIKSSRRSISKKQIKYKVKTNIRS